MMTQYVTMFRQAGSRWKSLAAAGGSYGLGNLLVSCKIPSLSDTVSILKHSAHERPESVSSSYQRHEHITAATRTID